ncbi:serine/threonine-protein phosphatase 4 regulatory subunit 4 [Elysia marginata]|uniref:Serine/threonine-protein phosphatase 4 regulatory subunit 4 n=1 Tax=Elysia marginata TaxID=1093978 RepID=A0AAV4ENN7_9GAST|nr:serine/threonine-protein phosphatase 4 regulatory subunit 4 [Elysia marginata]
MLGGRACIVKPHVFLCLCFDQEVLHVANLDMQLAAATAFLQILERKLVAVDEYKKTFLQTILASVDNKNEDVAQAWLETLLSCIDLLPKDVVKKDVLSIAVNKGQLSQTLQARLSCCKILGKVSSKFENFIVKNDVLPVVLSLCGDVEYDVRACMCQRLDVVAHGLGLELTKSKLLPQLIELSEDESQSVICACLETTANIIGMLDREANVNAILPMVKELLEKAINNVDSSLPVAAKLFGRFCHSLLEYMTVEDKAYFQEYFKKLCKIGVTEKKNKEESSKLMEALDIFEATTDTGTEARMNAAYNFPAMVLFIGAKLFRLELYPCFSQLCRDPHVAVRKTIAAGFHEVAKLLGTNVGIIFPELNSLLNDADIEVLKAIVPNFKDIVAPLAHLGVEQFTEHRAHAVQDVVTNFLRGESIVFQAPCWRTQEAMLCSMQSLHQLCNNDFLYNRVMPILIDKLKVGRALPVKITAAKTVITLARHLRYKNQREAILQILKEDFYGSDSCYRRSLFLELAGCYLQVNSKQAFKDHFYDQVLSMKSDRVATVRLKMLSLFPEMKRSLKLPRDQALRTALDTVLRQIIVYDKDTDVQQAAQQMSEELTFIQEGSDNTRTNRRNLTVEEEEDLKREDEEKELIAREEKERKEEEARLAKGTEKRNSVSGKKDLGSKIPGAKKSITSKTSQGIQGGSKGDGLHQTTAGGKPRTSHGQTATSNHAHAGAKDQSCPLISSPKSLHKSKSTTSIPTMIPRPEPRPSTPTRREAARKIPVLVSSKRASSPALTGPTSTSTSSTKKNPSPTPSKKSSLSSTASGSSLSPLSSSSSLSTRRGSANSSNSTVLARRGSMGSANSNNGDMATKVKTATSKTGNALGVSRTPKKSGK